MDLFKNTLSYTFRIPEPAKLPELSAQFDKYRQGDLASFWNYVRGHLDRPVRVLGQQGVLSPEGYIPALKSASPRKGDLMRFCALVHCCPENIRLLMSILPAPYGDVMAAIVRRNCVSYSELQRMGAPQMLSRTTYYGSWHEWSRGASASLLLVRESTMEGEELKEHHYEKDAYLFLPDFLVPLYARALAPEMTDPRGLWQDKPDQGLHVLSAENAFLASFPLIQGIHRQSGIKLNGLKISAALAQDILSRTSIQEAIPASLRNLMKVNTGQYLLPPLVTSLEEHHVEPAENHVKHAVSLLSRAYAAYLYPAYLPHIKGFRSNTLKGSVRQRWMYILGCTLASYPDKWVSLEALNDFIHGGSNPDWAVGYTLRCELLRDMYLLNTITGTAILPNNQGDEIDQEMLRASALALYALGAAEIAVETPDHAPDTPCGCIRQVRLTGLGRYAFDIDKEYHAAESESRDYFTLDENRLIIQSLSGNNPYESLLTDTATPIGGGKFVMSAESFLRNCSTKKDVDEKIAFFEDYVADDPPPVWKDFFKTIRQRCNPLLPVKGQYILLQLNPDNKPLADLVLGDSEIRPLIIMAEDYRILVRKDNYDKLSRLLKKHGYLL